MSQYGVAPLHMPSPVHGVAGAASLAPLDEPDEDPEELEPDVDPLPLPLLDDELPPSSLPELDPDELPELVDEPEAPEEPPSPDPDGVELLLPPHPIPMAMAMQTLAQALEAYIRLPPGGARPQRHPRLHGGSVP